jgi:uncharacterized protein (TIGR03083 family)
MAKMDVWPAILAERKALVTDLEGVSEDQWSAPSLCTGWTVRDVLAHMTATAKITPPGFFAKMLTSGFSFPRMQAKDIAVERGSSAADALARFEAVLTSRSHPPGPSDTMLGETVIHSEDIRRPLGIRHDYPMDALVQVGDFLKGSNLIIGAKRRIDGLTLHATDTQWSHGTGPGVSGSMLSLVIAMTGRRVADGELSGEGAETLRARAGS